MAHRRTKFDPHGGDGALPVGAKLPRPGGGNIKEKISLWEGKEPSGVTPGTGVKKTESQISRRGPAEQEAGRENGGSRPRSPDGEKENVGTPADTGGLRGGGKLNGNQIKDDHGGVLEDRGPRSPAQEQTGTPRRGGDRKGQEKRAVFTLFRKLEAMGENRGRTPTELGNYFSPPGRGRLQGSGGNGSAGSGQTATVRVQSRENAYAEPGAPPINPVPKPQRTFQHPSSEKGRCQRNLPPLPTFSFKPPSGVFLRPRGERLRDDMNR